MRIKSDEIVIAKKPVLILLIFLLNALPAFAFNLSFGQGAIYYYSTNSAAAGFTNEYRLELPLNERTFARLSYINLNHYGQLSGLKLIFEKYFSLPWEGKGVRMGVFYAGYWGNPVIILKDSYVDELPNFYHEVGVTLIPLVLGYRQFVVSLFEASIGMNPLASAGKFNVYFTLLAVGINQ